VLSSSLSSAHAYETVASEINGGDARTQANLADYIIDKLGGRERAAAVLSSLDTGRRQELVDGYVRQYVEERANLIKQGDPGKHADVAIQAIGVAPQGDPRALYDAGTTKVNNTSKEQTAKIPGNPGAAPSVVVPPDSPGQQGVRITPTTVRNAAKAGDATAKKRLVDGRGEAGDGRREVARPVEGAIDDPNIVAGAAKKAFAGGKPQDGNPAAKPTNTGGASGEW